MRQLSPLLHELIQSFCCLPGVGPKSAQRMAYSLLQRQKINGLKLANTLKLALESIGQCQQCRNLTEEPICQLCLSSKRRQDQLCVVESPADVLLLEQTASYHGRYFVLHGALSPLDGIGPQEIGLPLLKQLLRSQQFKEVILATNPTTEGEATAHYIAELAKKFAIQTTQLAQGVPLGSELMYLDSHTLLRALASRSDI